jgi:signal transduction histidine kinase
VTAKSAHRVHAARVAGMATVVVIVAYVVGVVVLNLLVVHRLTAQADVRLSERLVDARSEVLRVPTAASPSVHSDADVDDAPAFVWQVSVAGTATALTSGAPPLARHQWGPGAITLGSGTSSFRFQAARSGSGWLVAGESIGQIKRVQSALVLPEVLVGSVLLILVFAGSLAVGLRASAPLEVIRRRQSEFTADASHELRTPLTVIEAEVELALSRPREGPAYRAVLERVASEGRRLRSIVDDLLWLARADEAPAAGSDEVEVAALAEACVDRFMAVAAARGVDLRFVRLGDGPTGLQASAAWIDRLIGVLVDNALRFAGPQGSVGVRVGTSALRIVLDVDDSGPGIPIEDRDAIFDRFHRGNDDPGGTGLGLAIADSVVRATEGTWSVKAAPLGGARMEVSWRRAGIRAGKVPARGRLYRRPRSAAEPGPSDPATRTETLGSA